MSILASIEAATGQIISTLETTPAIGEVLTALEKDITFLFPPVGETITSLDEIITAVDDIIHQIAAQNATTAPVGGSTDPKPVTTLTETEEALLAKVAHMSATNEEGQHIVQFLEPIAAEVASVGQASVDHLQELSAFLKTVRNQQGVVVTQ